MNAPVSLLCDEDAHTRADATLRLYCYMKTALLYYSSMISVFQIHALLRSNGNYHPAIRDFHDYIVVAREDGSRDCSSIPCASARDSFQGKRKLRIKRVLAGSRGLVWACLEILNSDERIGRWM